MFSIFRTEADQNYSKLFQVNIFPILTFYGLAKMYLFL